MTEVGAGIEQPINIEDKPVLGSMEIPVGPDKVGVSWAEFKPPLKTDQEREAFDPTKAVIFLPGWPWKAAATTTWDQPRALSEEFGIAAYEIDTEVDRITPDSLNIEAEAIRLFLEKQQLEEVTIFGHSEGGIRAANLAVLLEQKNPDIKINGVVLANSMGVYPQSFLKELAPNFISEVLKVESKEQNPKMSHTFSKWLQVMVEFAKSAPKNPKRFAQEMINMMKVNERLKQIKTPVVWMSTEKDFVANHRKYMPDAEVQQRMVEPQSIEELRRYAEGRFDSLSDKVKSRYGNKESYVGQFMQKYESDEYMKKFRTREEIARRGPARKQHISEQVLPNSNAVEVVVATNYGSHVGLPVERPNQTAYVLSRFFKRMSRKTS